MNNLFTQYIKIKMYSYYWNQNKKPEDIIKHYDGTVLLLVFSSKNLSQYIHLLTTIKHISFLYIPEETIILPEFIESLSVKNSTNIIIHPKLKKYNIVNNIVNIEKGYLPETLEELSICSKKIENLYLPKYLKLLRIETDDILDLSNLPNIEELIIRNKNVLDFSFLPCSLKKITVLKYGNIIFENLPPTIQSLSLLDFRDFPNNIPTTIKNLEFRGNGQSDSLTLNNHFDVLDIQLKVDTLEIKSVKELTVKSANYLVVPNNIEKLICENIRYISFKGKCPNLIYLKIIHNQILYNKPKHIKIINGFYSKYP